MQHSQKRSSYESRVTVVLSVAGGPGEAARAKQQVEHYAQSLAGVKVDR